MIVKDANQPHAQGNFCLSSSLDYYEGNQPIVSSDKFSSSHFSHSSCAENITHSEYLTKLAPKFPFLKSTTSRQFPVGSRQYVVSLSISHSATCQNMYRSSEILMELDQVLHFNVTENLNDFYKTNHVVLGAKQFCCFLSVNPLGFKVEHSTDLSFRVDLTEESEGITYILVEDERMMIIAEFEIIEDQSAKTQIINNMNFKINKSFCQEGFVKLNKYFIEFKSQDSKCDLALSTDETGPTEFKQEVSKNQTHQKQKVQINLPRSPIKLYQQPQQPQDEYDPEFINTIKTQAGSKQFQKKAKSLTRSEIDSIINQILPCIDEITLNGYANYMLQSLHEVCNYEQRMKIILSLGQKLSSLVCQQQGTFVFQHLLTRLQIQGQFQAICNFILPEFKTIALNSYGHHFLRKMFELMPPFFVTMFVPAVHMYFIEMSTSQHAVFIVRSMVKLLKRMEDQFGEYLEHLERLLQNLSSNIDLFMAHEYGNYLVQEVYQTIESERLQNITNYIITFFTDVSCGKFSSNIILNCLKKNWSMEPQILTYIEKRLDRKDIKNMFRNKDGNKVLLELMELHQVPELVNKISLVVRGEDSIKFNSKRWTMVVGKARTGEVGTKYTSFSQAHHSFTKRRYQG